MNSYRVWHDDLFCLTHCPAQEVDIEVLESLDSELKVNDRSSDIKGNDSSLNTDALKFQGMISSSFKSTHTDDSVKSANTNEFNSSFKSTAADESNETSAGLGAVKDGPSRENTLTKEFIRAIQGSVDTTSPSGMAIDAGSSSRRYRGSIEYTSHLNSKEDTLEDVKIAKGPKRKGSIIDTLLGRRPSVDIESKRKNENATNENRPVGERKNSLVDKFFSKTTYQSVSRKNIEPQYKSYGSTPGLRMSILPGQKVDPVIRNTLFGSTPNSLKATSSNADLTKKNGRSEGNILDTIPSIDEDAPINIKSIDLSSDAIVQSNSMLKLIIAIITPELTKARTHSDSIDLMTLFNNTQKFLTHEERLNSYERRINTPVSTSSNSTPVIPRGKPEGASSHKFAETLSMFESKSKSSLFESARPQLPHPTKKFSSTLSNIILLPSPITPPANSRVFITEKVDMTHDESKAKILKSTQSKIISLTIAALLFCDRVKIAAPEEFIIFSHEFRELVAELRLQVYAFIGQTSSAIGTVDLRRNGIELSRFEKQFSKEFGSGKPTNEFRNVLALINTNVDYSMRRYANNGSKKLMIKASEGYRDEGVVESQLGVTNTHSRDYATAILEHVPDCGYYRMHFFGQDHSTYAGIMDKLGPVIISIKREDIASDDDLCYRAILRVLDQPERRELIMPARIKKTMLGKVNPKKVIELLHKDIQSSKLKLIEDKNIENRLIQLDELKTTQKYKFGVLLCAPGQTTDNEFFQNLTGSLGYERFLTILGDKIELNSFKGFMGGLDNNQGRTGVHSVYTKWRNNEIMYHVSTLLPYVPGDAQQIERKRHLGNDIINIIYLDGDVEFDPTTIKTHFTHIFIVIKEETFTDMGPPIEGYRVAITSNTDVPKYGPAMPNPSRFYAPNELRDFLLARMINGENAAYKAPRFAKPHTRTHHAIFENIIDEYFKFPQKKKTLGGSIIVNTSQPDSPITPRSPTSPKEKQNKSMGALLALSPLHSVHSPLVSPTRETSLKAPVLKMFDLKGSHSKSASCSLYDKPREGKNGSLNNLASVISNSIKDIAKDRKYQTNGSFSHFVPIEFKNNT